MPWWPHQLAVSGLPSGRRRQNCAGAGRPRARINSASGRFCTVVSPGSQRRDSVVGRGHVPGASPESRHLQPRCSGAAAPPLPQPTPPPPALSSAQTPDLGQDGDQKPVPPGIVEPWQWEEPMTAQCPRFPGRKWRPKAGWWEGGARTQPVTRPWCAPCVHKCHPCLRAGGRPPGRLGFGPDCLAMDLGRPARSRLFNSIPSLHPLEASSTLPSRDVTIRIVPQHFRMSPGEGKTCPRFYRLWLWEASFSSRLT